MLLIAVLVTLYIPGRAQAPGEVRIPLIGEHSPEFIAESTQGTIHFPGDYFKKWKILFSHPADFTAVCSTEILELAALQDDFNKMGVQLVVLSTDGLNSHIEWEHSLEKIDYKGRPPAKINFPLIEDKDLSISKQFGMIHPYSDHTRDVRGVFIIDPDDEIRAILFYPSELGRNYDEIKRMVVGLQTADRHHVLIPADWKPGQDVMIQSPATSAEAEKLKQKNEKDLYDVTWYMWFRNLR